MLPWNLVLCGPRPMAWTLQTMLCRDDALRRPGAVSLDTDGLESADPLQSALISSVSGFSARSMPSSPAVDMGFSGQHLFLDICSGATRPLSPAALDVGMQVLFVDPSCAGKLDLFNNAHYGQLLRISFSGMIWFACASPPCGDFSTIEFRPGPGPRSIHTCEYLLGIPDATASRSARIRSSLCLRQRAASLLLAGFQAGGHVSLEQPLQCLILATDYGAAPLARGSALFGYVAAGAYDLSVHSAGCLPLHCDPGALACVCEHGRSTHIDVAGRRLEDGTYLSRGTAEYPASLAPTGHTAYKSYG